MKHLSVIVDTGEKIFEFLGTEAARSAITSAKSILVQLYTGKSDVNGIKQIVSAIHAAMPGAVVIGATSAGEISDGQVSLESTMVSFSFFQSSDLFPISQDCQLGKEYETGIAIAQSAFNISHLKGILLLAPPTLVNCARLLDGINDHLPGIQILGGGAAGINSQTALVFLNDIFFDTGGAVAVALAGEDLHLAFHTFLGWKALGPRVTLTEVKDFDILTIDDKPAFDAYRKYLNLESGDDLFLLEFPLLIERHGTVLARNPVSADEDGRVTLVADVYKGESARLGYLDVDAVIENMESTLAAMEQFAPEAIFLYSCICRRFSLQQDTELETLPFQRIAPVAGFFTYGEFCKTSNRLELLNSSQVVVGMREGEPKPILPSTAESIKSEVDRYRVRHIRITSRLFHFISALTDQVEDANRILQFQADHDLLTGAFNRHALSKNVDLEIARSRRYGHKLSFILFDIDHFKHINDEYGHSAGDFVLKNISDVAHACTRVNDALYRYGGEEFILLLPETSLAGGVAVAEKVRKCIESLSLLYDGNKLPIITASFGVACYPDHGDSAEMVISTADIAMYNSKNQGRNRVSAGEGKTKA